MATIEPYTLAAGQKLYRVRLRVDGKQTTKRGFTTKREAEKYAATAEVAKLTGAYVAPSAGRVLVGDWVRLWRDGRADLSPSTAERYDGIIRTHIAPRWDKVALADVRHSEVQAWTTQLAATGMAAASVRKTHRVLSLALDLAVADRLIVINPAGKVRIAKPTITPRRYLSHDKVRALADAAGDRGAVVLVLAYCGLRWGELAALRVRHVDLMRRRITVEESVTEVGGKLVWGNPKTSQRRIVPIPRFVADALTIAMAGKGPDDLAFTGERKGGVLRTRVARRSWFDAAVVESGCPDGFHPHELRHTAASLAISAGANVKAVQKMLGHASAAMTLDTYSDLFPDDLDAVATALDLAASRSIVVTDVVTIMKGATTRIG